MEIIKIKHGSESGYDEWMYKEYGSWEDHDCAPDHVYSILQREIGGTHMEITREEAETLLKSISFHANGNTWDEATLGDKACWRGYENRIKKALA